MAYDTIRTTNTVYQNLVEISDQTKTAVFPAQQSDLRIDRLVVSTDDTSAKVVKVFIKDGTNSYQFDSQSIPAESGTKSDGSVRTFDMLSSMTGLFKNIDGNGNKFCMIKTGWQIEVQLASAPTSGKKIWVNISGGLYD
jgi:hypothetical protein